MFTILFSIQFLQNLNKKWLNTVTIHLDPILNSYIVRKGQTNTKYIFFSWLQKSILFREKNVWLEKSISSDSYNLFVFQRVYLFCSEWFTCVLLSDSILCYSHHHAVVKLYFLYACSNSFFNILYHSVMFIA